MIATLEQAYAWYTSARTLASSMNRMGEKYWDSLTKEGLLWADDQLRPMKSENIIQQSLVVLQDLDDLCVLLLFSVFEAIVRSQVLQDIHSQLPVTNHPSIERAITAMKLEIEEGSFWRVLEPFKGIDSDLIEKVNQVRRYRNWVAHGRRGVQPPSVNPKNAHDRLQRFLDLLLRQETDAMT